MIKKDPFNILKQRVADLMKEVISLREENLGNRSVISRLDSSHELLSEELAITKLELSNYDKENNKTLDKIKKLRSDRRKLKAALKKTQGPSTPKLIKKVTRKAAASKEKARKKHPVRAKKTVSGNRKKPKSSVSKRGKVVRIKSGPKKTTKSKSLSAKVAATKRKSVAKRKVVKAVPKKKAVNKRVATTKRNSNVKTGKPVRSKNVKKVVVKKRKFQKKKV